MRSRRRGISRCCRSRRVFSIWWGGRFRLPRHKGVPMEVILREDVERLGTRGDVVKVAAGYARNFLLPQKLAVAATDSNKKIVEQERRGHRHRRGDRPPSGRRRRHCRGG